VHHCVGGSGRACCSQPPDGEDRVDTALPGSFGGIYAVPADSGFVLAYLHTRYGDAGPLGRFANHLWEIEPLRRCISTLQGNFDHPAETPK
jgi:hypothetical protein